MIITQTPLRISLAGGGTDFADFYEKNGGCVVSTAIDKYVYCIAKERFDDKIYVNWTKKEIVESVDQIEHELVREALRKVGVVKGIEISFLSDIPAEGSGLGVIEQRDRRCPQRPVPLRRGHPDAGTAGARGLRYRNSDSQASPLACRTSTSPHTGDCAASSLGRGRR